MQAVALTDSCLSICYPAAFSRGKYSRRHRWVPTWYGAGTTSKSCGRLAGWRGLVVGLAQSGGDRYHRLFFLHHRVAQHARMHSRIRLWTVSLIFRNRMRALIRKEFRQILRDRRLAMSLILPPTLQLLLFGFALNATVGNLRLAWWTTAELRSRELAATMTESKSSKRRTYLDVNEMSKKSRTAIWTRACDSLRLRARSPTRASATVQVLLNAMNSNTATIGEGYAQGVIASYNQTLVETEYMRVPADRLAGRQPPRHGPAASRVPVQSGPRTNVVYRDRRARRALILNVADFLGGDRKGTRGRHARTVVDVPATTTQIIVASFFRCSCCSA